MISLDFKIHGNAKIPLSIRPAPEAYQPNTHSTCASFVSLSHSSWICWFSFFINKSARSTHPQTPHKGFCVGLSLRKTSGEIIYQDCGCHPAIVVLLMSMLIFIINDVTSGQSAWDCGEGRGAARWFVSARTPEIKVRRGFSWWSDEVNEAKEKRKKKKKTHAERERDGETQQISIDTHTTHLGHDDKVRKRNISGGWMRELSQRNGCGVLNVGGSEAGGSFMEPHDHPASELEVYVLLGEKWEILVHHFATLYLFLFFLKEIAFQHRWGGWALRKLDLLSQMSVYFSKARTQK